MATKIRYIAVCKIGGFEANVYVQADTPEEVVATVQDLFKEIESKVQSIKVADEASGFFLRGFS